MPTELTDAQVLAAIRVKWPKITNISVSDVEMFRLGVEQERARCARVCRQLYADMGDGSLLLGAAKQCAQAIERGQ